MGANSKSGFDTWRSYPLSKYLATAPHHAGECFSPFSPTGASQSHPESNLASSATLVCTAVRQ